MRLIISKSLPILRTGDLERDLDIVHTVRNVVPLNHGADNEQDFDLELVYDVKSQPWLDIAGGTVIRPDITVRPDTDDDFYVIAYYNQSKAAIVFFSGICRLSDERSMIVSLDDIPQHMQLFETLLEKVRSL